MAYKRDWVVINEVPTMVRTWGGWIEDDLKSKNILLFITGNPGITSFYIEFLSSLHLILQMPVWCVSHAGHEIPRPMTGLKLPKLTKHPGLYTLDAQIRHKSDFIKKYVPKDRKLYLIGHSVGGKIAVELLKDKSINEMVPQAHLIFPTLENFGKTKNAWYVNNITLRFALLLYFLTHIFCLLPYCLRFFMARSLYYLRLNFFSIHDCSIHGLVKLVDPEVFRSATYLAKKEMVDIRELDHQVYEENYKKIKVYYGQNDGWTEPHHFDNMKAQHPEINARMLDSKFKHAFTLETASEMAELLSREIKQ